MDDGICPSELDDGICPSELAYPPWSEYETGVSTDPDPDPIPDPDLTMHRFAGKLLGYMKGKARDSQLVMKAQVSPILKSDEIGLKI